MNFNGIDLSDNIIEALENDKLVVFAGTGISMGRKTYCPDFSMLAGGIAKYLEEDPVNTVSVEQFLGALERKCKSNKNDGLTGIVNISEEVIYCRHEAIYGNVSQSNDIKYEELEPNDIHYDLVKLLHGVKKREVRIVTTNFEHYLTKAYTENIDECETKNIYYAPALPNGQDFSGLVYLHGAYEDKSIGREFVITDKGFGKAYLTNGYANKFIQELFASDYTVLFIGYSYNDTIMRYLTRALGGDKEKLYAFADYETDDEKIEIVNYWDDLDITAIPYQTKGSDHSNLDKAIAKLVEYVYMTSEDHINRIEDLCKEISLGSPPSCSYLKYMIERNNYKSVFIKNSMTREHLKWAEVQGLLVSTLRHENNIQNEPYEPLLDWAIDLFFEYPDDFFRVKQASGGLISGYFWMHLVLKFSKYIDRNYPNIDIEYFTSRLKKFVPFILEYNPISLSMPNDLYQHVFTMLTQKLLLIDNDYCFDIAMKFFLYLTTPHTTSIYDVTFRRFSKKVRFYGLAHSLNEISDNFTEGNYYKISRLQLGSIVRNLEQIKSKFVNDNIESRSFESHINDKKEGYCLVTILKGVISKGKNMGSKLYIRVRSILDDIEKNDEIYTKNMSSPFWIDYQKQADSVDIEFIKSNSELVKEWLIDSDTYRVYCIENFGFNFIDGKDIFKALSNVFQDDPEFITDMICSFEQIPDNASSAIPRALTVDFTDDIVISCINKLLLKSGDCGYYRGVLDLLLYLIENNDEWCRYNIDDIEKALDIVHKLLKEIKDEHHIGTNDYLSISINSLGGKYGQLISLSLLSRYKIVSTENAWEEIPDFYSKKLNYILQAPDYNFQMARIMLYSDLYNYNALDKNYKLIGLFEGVYWEQGCDKELFIQAWYGHIWNGSLQPKNIEKIFSKGICECINWLKDFTDDVQRVIINYLIAIAINVESIEKKEVISAFFNVIKQQFSIDGCYFMVLQRIINHFDNINGSGFTNEWNKWLKKLVEKRVKPVPVGVELKYSELKCITGFLYYLDYECCEDLLGYIGQAISRMDFSNIGSYVLPISRFKQNAELDYERRVILARAFKLCSPILSHGNCFSIKSDLSPIIYKDKEIIEDIFKIVVDGINNSDLTIAKKDSLINDLKYGAGD